MGKQPYREEYVYLAGLSHRAALVAWGAFYFDAKRDGKYKLVDDDDLDHVHPPRQDSIGAKSKSYGPATVEIYDQAGKRVRPPIPNAQSNPNHCWVTDLEPDTRYRYRVFVKGSEWAAGQRMDWDPVRKGLAPGGRYDNAFITHPDPKTPYDDLDFAVIGDFGTGVRKKSTSTKRQREVADALERAVAEASPERPVRLILTTGDNIYARWTLLGKRSEGDEDDDWFFTFFQPYRYVINRVPVYPSIGNHDASESEETDDRDQVIDNFYINERIAGEEAAGRASIDQGLFYRFNFGSEIEFVCLDSSKELLSPGDKKAQRLFLDPRHSLFLDQIAGRGRPRWRIPFFHHPPFCAGPRHENLDGAGPLLAWFKRAGVRAVFSGHEHNFQHSAFDGVDFFVTGAAGKVRAGAPKAAALKAAHTRSWSATCHFLLVSIAGQQMRVLPIGECPAHGSLAQIRRKGPTGKPITEPMVLTV
jgi:tartrate-resistant acid phosphatase type 5